MKPHKHADLIKAWADGAEIEGRYLNRDGWGDWHILEGGFIWYHSNAEYRIKPQLEIPKEYYSESIKNEYYDEPPIKQYLYIYRGREGQTFVENYQKTMKDGFFTYMGKVEVIK